MVNETTSGQSQAGNAVLSALASYLSAPAQQSAPGQQASGQSALAALLASLPSYMNTGKQAQAAAPQVLSPGQYLASGQPARPSLAGNWSFNQYYQAPQISANGQALLSQAQARTQPTTSGFSYLTDLQNSYNRTDNMTASAKAAQEAKDLADQAKKALKEAQAAATHKSKTIPYPNPSDN